MCRVTANVTVVLSPEIGQACHLREKKLKKENYSRKMCGDKTQFLKDHMGTKSCVKYFDCSSNITKRKTKIILNSSYKITCSILRPNDHRCIKRSISVLFVCSTPLVSVRIRHNSVVWGYNFAVSFIKL